MASKKLKEYPELQRLKYFPRVDDDICKECGQCVKSCVYGSINFNKDAARAREEQCGGCGMCLQACPGSPIKLASPAEVSK